MTGHPFRGDGGQHDLPGLLICAGLDPSGGAGLIADVRVAAQLGTRPTGVVTALTVQNTTGVIATEAMSSELVREQLEFLLQDIEVRAVKIGMIGSSEIAVAVGAALNLTSAPVVWDPITAPSRGDIAFVDSLFGRAVTALAPHLTLITPNLRELEFLAGDKLGSLADVVAAGSALATRLDTAVLVKGGHLAGAEAVDVLCRGTSRDELPGRRVQDGEHVHGTGCALATAIAAQLARGGELLDACRAAKAFVLDRITTPARPGRGAAAVV